MNVQQEDYGPGPMISTATVQLIKDDVVTVLVADTLTRGERNLVDNGHSERVLQLRHDYQRVMADDLIAIVEGSSIGR